MLKSNPVRSTGATKRGGKQTSHQGSGGHRISSSGNASSTQESRGKKASDLIVFEKTQIKFAKKQE